MQACIRHVGHGPLPRWELVLKKLLDGLPIDEAVDLVEEGLLASAPMRNDVICDAGNL